MVYSNLTGLPSVSDIMEPYEDSRWFKPEHSERGDFVHGFAAADLLGLMTPVVPDQYSGYIESYFAFKPRIKRVLIVEQRFSSLRGYCGQVDLVAELDDVYNNCIALLDWKTSASKYKAWMARMGGYYGLLKDNGVGVTAGATVRLREKCNTRGWFPLVDFYNEPELKENYIDFLCAHRTYTNVLNYGLIYASYENIKKEY